MTKQEEIREGIEHVIMVNRPYLASLIAERIIEYLNDNKVVIKVKCPDCVWSQFRDETVGMTPCYRCNSTGCIIESLTGEE